jgi:hypothetical protein
MSFALLQFAPPPPVAIRNDDVVGVKLPQPQQLLHIHTDNAVSAKSHSAAIYAGMCILAH